MKDDEYQLKPNASRDFFAPAPTLDQLAKAQSVKPVRDVTELLGDF